MLAKMLTQLMEAADVKHRNENAAAVFTGATAFSMNQHIPQISSRAGGRSGSSIPLAYQGVGRTRLKYVNTVPHSSAPPRRCRSGLQDGDGIMKTRKTKNRLPPFIPLLVEMLDAPATTALSHGALRLYVALKRQYNPDHSDRRNGRVYLSQRRAHQEIRSDRAQIARWYRELQYYGFIVMTAPGCLGLDGKGKAPRWRLTEYGFMGDPPTKDFLRWRGMKFRDQKNQPRQGNPIHTGREIPSTTGREIPST
jgi:hypothetical protein